MSTKDIHTDPHEHDDDIVIEDMQEGTTDGFGRTRSEKELKEALKQAQEESRDNLAGWQRAKADLINFKREAEEGKASLAQFAAEGLITELIPVLDSFEMAMGNTAVWEQVDKNWRMGIEHIHTQLCTALEGRGLQKIDPEGQAFDPLEHESAESIAVDNVKQDNIVQEVIQKGYKLHDRIVRPARVKVGHLET